MLQGREQASVQLVEILFGVIDPDRTGLVNDLAAPLKSLGNRDGFLYRISRLAGAGRRQGNGEVAAQ